MKDLEIRSEMHLVHDLVEINHEIAVLVHNLQHEREIVAAYVGSKGTHHAEDLEPAYEKSNKSMKNFIYKI